MTQRILDEKIPQKQIIYIKVLPSYSKSLLTVKIPYFAIVWSGVHII